MADRQVLPRIRKLSASVANRIAAGEVVERPSSVVKELLENSIDAGASRIDISVRHGGIRYIRVTDNGHGIHPADFPLLLHRHSTSKLQSAADLLGITTLGFRGEALSSIAAVARFRLTSCTAPDATACVISSEPGTGASSVRPAAHPPGTTVTVEDLFEQVPARRRFLRSEHTEQLHVLETVRRLALSRFDVDIRLQHQDKEVLRSGLTSYPPSLRLQTLLGKAVASGMLAVDASSGDYRLWGWIGPPASARSHTDRQFFFLNQRVIRDRRINHAVRTAYGDELKPGRYPAYVLYLELAPASVDINVHPAKYEVRLQNTRDVHDFIYAVVREGLREGSPKYPATGSGTGSDSPGMAETSHVYTPAPFAPVADDSAPATGLGVLVSVVCGRYGVSRRGADWLLLDLRELRRTVIRGALLDGLHDGGVAVRPLLVPLQLTVSSRQMAAAERFAEPLSAMGLTLSPVSPEAVLAREIPSVLAHGDLQAMVLELLTLLAEKPGWNAGCAQQAVTRIAELECPNVTSPFDLAGLVRQLGAVRSLACNTDNAAHRGLWRTLTADSLQRLLDEHD